MEPQESNMIAFKMVSISIFIGTALIVAAMVLNRTRPHVGSGGYLNKN